MDFTLSDEQQAIVDLASTLLREQVTAERLKAAEADGASGFDGALWATLAEANLLGVVVPEAHGGLGLGPVELALLLEEVGRTVAPVPLLACSVSAAALARFGTDEQSRSVLPAVVAGELVLSAALLEPLGDPRRPTTTAVPDGDGWKLDGLKTCVSGGLVAGQVLIPATTAAGAVGLFLVATDQDGVLRRRQDTITRLPEAEIELDGVRVGAGGLIGRLDPEGAALSWLVELTTVAVSAEMVGVADAALRLTAEYTTSREQFDRPIATFQAVGQRAADAFVDTESIRLTALKAAWQLADDRPAAKEVAVAKYFASEAGQRVVRASVHLHGGVGVDRDYPLHRYYQRAKQLELTLGGAGRQLETLGRLLAEEPVAAD